MYIYGNISLNSSYDDKYVSDVSLG